MKNRERSAVALTPHHVALAASAAPIEEQLPIRFANGGRWEEVACDCDECGGRIADHHLRGTVTVPFEAVAVMDAVGYCDRCGESTPFLIRYHSCGDLAEKTGGLTRPWGRGETWRERLHRWFYEPVVW